jgi:hypothetical protein
MRNTIQQYLSPLASATDKAAISTLLQFIASRLNSVATASAGLVIKAGGGVLAKIGATAFRGTVNGRQVTVAASTDMPALTGLTIAANTFNVACFFIDAAGTVTVAFGTQGGTAAAVVFPDFPVDKALVGFLLITHSSTFTGNTTALDTATTVYVSPVGAFDPTILFN